jgi:VanZ family protein
MRGLLAFLIAGLAMGALSLPYESWGLPVWPVAVMTLASGMILGLIPGLEKYRIHLAAIYFSVFLLMWLQSFPRAITPKATLYHFRGLVWMMTWSAFGLVALITIADLLRRIRSDLASRKAIVFAIAAIFMGSLIAFASGPGAGAGRMFGWFQYIGLTESQAEIAVLILRKIVHFVYYGLMALVAAAAAHAALRKSQHVKRAVLVGFLFMLVHAVFDEGRQSNVSIRTGSWIDVGIDSLGAICFLWIAYGRKRKERRRMGVSTG